MNVETTSYSLQVNKSSTSKKVSTLLFDVKIVVQKHVQTLMEAVDTAAVDLVNLSRSPVLIVEQKTQYHSSQKAIDQYFVVTALEKVSKANY